MIQQIVPSIRLIYSKRRMSTQLVVQQLFQNAQFILLLKDQVEMMVGDTIIKRSQSRSSFEMVEEIHTVIGKIIELNIKEEMTQVTDGIFRSLLEVRQEAEKSISSMMDTMKEEGDMFQKRIEQTVKDIKKDVMSNSIRIDKRISTMSRASTNPMTIKLKDISNQLTIPDQNIPKSLKLLPFSSKGLPDLDSTCSQQLKSRLQQFQKTISQIQSVLIDIENRLHQRYEVNIASLWTVVAEIQGKLLTEEKVESKLVDLRGSMLLASDIKEKQKEEKVLERSKRWFNF